MPKLIRKPFTENSVFKFPLKKVEKTQKQIILHQLIFRIDYIFVLVK